MIIGTVLVAAALSFFLFNQREAKMAEKNAAEVLARLMEYIDTYGKNENLADIYDPSMKAAEIDGYAYIGYLSIPDLNLQLPVMSQWDDTRLDIAPCRYSGTVKMDNLVIAGHNYEGHFGKISRLSGGNIVEFTDVDGVSYSYIVAAVDILEADAVEDMTAGDYDLTLFTCDYGGQNRITVRCDKK